MANKQIVLAQPGSDPIPALEFSALTFGYVNWRGDPHLYVVDFTAGHHPGVGLQQEDNGTWEVVMSGEVITRDGDPRLDMGDNRRRSFIIHKMINIEVGGGPMNRAAFSEFRDRHYAVIAEINDKKGHDYAGDDDALANFKAGARRLGLTPEQIWGVYASKHWSAIETFVKEGDVQSEPIEGRIHDVILYCFLLLGLIEDQGTSAGENVNSAGAAEGGLTSTAPPPDPLSTSERKELAAMRRHFDDGSDGGPFSRHRDSMG